MFEHWVDNRDIRDKGYKGPLIVLYDETNWKHELSGKHTKKEALETIKKIMTFDLEDLNKKLDNLKTFEKELAEANENLIFTEFYEYDFYNIVSNFIDNGVELYDHYTLIDGKRLKEIKNYTDKQINRYGDKSFSGFSVNDHVSFSEQVFLPIYLKHKDELGWFWNKNPYKNFHYKTVEDFNEVINTCKKRLKEIENLL